MREIPHTTDDPDGPSSGSPPDAVAPSVPSRLHVLVAAAPTRPGVEAVFADVEARARAGLAVSVLFTEDGLAALQSPWPARLAAAGVHTSLCARSARARKVNPIAVPATVLWSSLTVFARGVAEGARLWTVFP